METVKTISFKQDGKSYVTNENSITHKIYYLHISFKKKELPPLEDRNWEATHTQKHMVGKPGYQIYVLIPLEVFLSTLKDIFEGRVYGIKIKTQKEFDDIVQWMREVYGKYAYPLERQIDWSKPPWLNAREQNNVVTVAGKPVLNRVNGLYVRKKDVATSQTPSHLVSHSGFERRGVNGEIRCPCCSGLMMPSELESNLQNIICTVPIK